MKRGRLVKIQSFILLVIVIITSGFVWPKKSLAQHDDYPKLANYYLAWDIDDEEINQLAKWDIVILSPQALERNPQILTKLKQKNPKIKILAYVLIQEITNNSQIVAASDLYQKIYNTVDKNNWWLKTADGQHVNWWPNTWMINPALIAPKNNGQNWADFLPQFVFDNILKNNDWDGTFYDNAWPEVSWLNQPIDFDNNGIADSAIFMDNKWQEGIKQILQKTKDLAPDKLIIVNNNSNLYNQNLNGRMQENFPAQKEGEWTGSVNNYINNNLGYQPKYFIINTTTQNTGNKENYQAFRYGLTSTLLGDGYYSFDYGDQAHESLWWYDEYNFFLGQSVSNIKNLLEQNSQQIKPGVWQRDFQNASIIVNSTNSEQKINFSEDYEKIKGSQDPVTNNGSIVRSVTLKANDGIILLRKIQDIKQSPYYNGSFVRVFDPAGDTVRNGFFIYNKQFKGGNVLAKEDINKDGITEIIVADLSKITIYDQNKKVLNTFYPYGTKYTKGLNFAITDFENDGYKEIVTGTMRGSAPLVKIYNYKGEAINKGFYAYSKNYLGGVNVAVGDLNGNGQKQIVTGAGYLGGPQIRIFDINGKVLSGGFFAYAKTFRGGVNVACGDIDGNGVDEIVTGAGYGGSSHVRMFNSKFEALNIGFWAFGKETRTGVRVVLNDLDGDGKKEILAASPDTFATAFAQ